MKWQVDMKVKDYIRNWSDQEIHTEYNVDQHIIICHFQKINSAEIIPGIFHPRTPGILVITVIEKIITVITRLNGMF